MTRNFIKLFLCSNTEQITLNDAAKYLLGDIPDATVMRTKRRRLYDIGNVLCAMQLIEKINQRENNKAAWTWLRLKEISTSSVSGPPFSTEIKKMGVWKRLH
ncbi:E2F transcription factor-like E2FF [Silene latifolia]|uniref:E2F transcription factor-like E2FF n=1 Tax=Silene latifolia TaxID=37657 RepID=UPI003D76CC18